MNNTTLILVNGFHIGDLFSLPEIVRAVCESNPLIQVEFAVYNSFYLFRNLAPNLTIIPINDHPLSKTIVDAIPGNILCVHPSENVYILNFAGLQHMPGIAGRQLECHYYNLYMAMGQLMNHVNGLWGTSFVLRPCLHPTSLIPRIPDTDCSLFETWRMENQNKMCILYYNFMPRSGQQIGIHPMNHDNIVYQLCYRFPDATILVPMFSQTMLANPIKPNNLLSCEESFGCNVSPDCSNLCKLAKMETQCDISIHFDIGACFYYASTLLYNESRCTILHVSRDHFYYYRLRENFGDSISEAEYSKKVHLLQGSMNRNIFLNRITEEINGKHAWHS